jgi:hypothetical protein
MAGWKSSHTSRDCHSWKYLEIDTKPWDNVPWVKEESNLDKWDEYQPIFNINNFGGKVYQNTFGMYARGLDIPLRIEDPFCNAVTKVVLEGKVSRIRRLQIRKSELQHANPQKRFSDVQMNLAIFDIDPSRIPADCPIYTYRKWRSLPDEDKEGMLEILQELSDCSSVHEVKGGTEIRKSDLLQFNPQKRFTDLFFC